MERNAPCSRSCSSPRPPALLADAEVLDPPGALAPVHQEIADGPERALVVHLELVGQGLAHGFADEGKAPEDGHVLQRDRGLAPREDEGVGLGGPEGHELEQRALAATPHAVRGREVALQDPELAPQGLVQRPEPRHPPPPAIQGLRCRPAVETRPDPAVENEIRAAGLGRQVRETGAAARAGKQEAGRPADRCGGGSPGQSRLAVGHGLELRCARAVAGGWGKLW